MAHYFVIKESALAVDYNHVNLLSGSSNELKR
jgi:hypothetical protein